MISLDLLIATHNRRDLLKKALASVARARIPDGLGVRMVVIANNCTDGTLDMVGGMVDDFPLELVALSEAGQGRSHALNHGIRESSADLIGMIDDDERLDEAWFEVVGRWFASDRTIDFLGGPCVGDWQVERPSWVPEEFVGVLGDLALTDEVAMYGEGVEGIMMGGNAVVRRRALLDVGLYDPNLGRRGSLLLSGEDHDMHQKLVRAGYVGYYDPELVIHHWIPAERVTKKYFRRWTYWNFIGVGHTAQLNHDGVPTLLGVPRYLWTDTLRMIARAVLPVVTLRLDDERVFRADLGLRALAGYARGRWMGDPEA